MSRDPFDPLRASFWLVAGVLGVHGLVVLVGIAVCAWRILGGGDFECDPKGRLGDLLTGALAAALAFSGGLNKPREPP